MFRGIVVSLCVFATKVAECVNFIPRKGDRPENSVLNGDLLFAESVLQVVVVGVGEYTQYIWSYARSLRLALANSA